MRELKVVQEKQPDGTINHLSESGCPLGICVVTGIVEALPDKCDNLVVKFGGWYCTKEPCQGDQD
jgi:hypothetical protein